MARYDWLLQSSRDVARVHVTRLHKHAHATDDYPNADAFCDRQGGGQPHCIPCCSSASGARRSRGDATTPCPLPSLPDMPPYKHGLSGEAQVIKTTTHNRITGSTDTPVNNPRLPVGRARTGSVGSTLWYLGAFSCNLSACCWTNWDGRRCQGQTRRGRGKQAGFHDQPNYHEGAESISFSKYVKK